MHPNHHYLLNLGVECTQNRPDTITLDYGCGNGEIVEEGLQRGLSIYGVDVFHEASPDTRKILQEKGLLDNSIREIHNGKIPFEDSSFDVVTTNMVFEHVRDLEGVLHEINRVLKPGGILLALFPTKEVWREGHTGIPFLHWFPKGSRVRWSYAWLLRALGFGTFKSRPLGKWVADMLHYLDNFVFYRSQKTVVDNLVRQRFALTWLEPHHLAFRLRGVGLGAFAECVTLPGVRFLATTVFRRIAYVAFVARKV
jgi:SAM-dependent methyltransferase